MGNARKAEDFGTGVPASAIERITHAALEIMAKRASNREPGEKYSAADIADAVRSDQKGQAARYLAMLIVTGIQHYPLFVELRGGSQ